MRWGGLGKNRAVYNASKPSILHSVTSEHARFAVMWHNFSKNLDVIRCFRECFVPEIGVCKLGGLMLNVMSRRSTDSVTLKSGLQEHPSTTNYTDAL